MNAFTEAQYDTQPSSCVVVAIAQQLTIDQRADLNEALADPLIYGSTIAKVLSNWGYKVSETTVRKHRRHGCLCDE